MSKTNNKAEKYRKQFLREVQRLERIVKEEKRRGFDFKINPIPQTPKNVTRQDVEAIRNVTPSTIRKLGTQNKQVDIQQIKQQQKAIRIKNAENAKVRQAKSSVKKSNVKKSRPEDRKDKLNELKDEYKSTKEKIAEMKSEIKNIKIERDKLTSEVASGQAELQYLKDVANNVVDKAMSSVEGPMRDIESSNEDLLVVQAEIEALYREYGLDHDSDEDDPRWIEVRNDPRFIAIGDKIEKSLKMLAEYYAIINSQINSSKEALKALNKEYKELRAELMPKVQQLTDIKNAIEEKTKNIGNEQKRIFTNIVSDLLDYLRSSLMKDIDNEVYILFMREFEAFIKYASVEEILTNIEKFERTEGITFAQNGGEAFYSSEQDEMIEMSEILFKIIYPSGVPNRIKQQLDDISEKQAAKNLALYNKWNEQRRRNKLMKQNNTSRKRN